MSKATNPSQTLIHDFQTSIVSDVLIAISPEHGQKLAVLLAKFNENLLTNIVPIISEINTLKSAIIDEVCAPTPPPSTDNNLTMMIEERDDKEGWWNWWNNRVTRVTVIGGESTDSTLASSNSVWIRISSYFIIFHLFESIPLMPCPIYLIHCSRRPRRCGGL